MVVKPVFSFAAETVRMFDTANSKQIKSVFSKQLFWYRIFLERYVNLEKFKLLGYKVQATSYKVEATSY